MPLWTDLSQASVADSSSSEPGEAGWAPLLKGQSSSLCHSQLHHLLACVFMLTCLEACLGWRKHGIGYQGIPIPTFISTIGSLCECGQISLPQFPQLVEEE